MTSRIIAGFMSVLVAVLAAVVIPLGVIVTRQQARDFVDQTGRVAQTIGDIAEEHLDDHAQLAGLQTVLARFAANGYNSTVLDAGGHLVASAGAAAPQSVLRAAATGGPLPQGDDLVAVATPVGDGNALLGRVVVTRDTSAMDTRRRELWGLLAVAAIGAIAAGAVIAWLISRWIARPITRLARATHSVGHGTGGYRADHGTDHSPDHSTDHGTNHSTGDAGTIVRADERAGPAQVRELAASFNAMSDRVAALLAAQRNMTADVSHQLRTPLAALRLKLELHRDELPNAGAAGITAMIDETNRLTGLLDGLLAVARAEATAADPTRTDLATAVTDRVDVWRPVASDEQVELRADLTPTAADITPSHLEQILDNLIANAISASPPAGRITITASTGPARPTITVSDTGPGMTSEQRDHALRRWSTDHADHGGTGLGLTIARRLTEADHGTLTLDDAPGGGLAVTIRYPPTSPHGRPSEAAPRATRPARHG